MPSRYLRIPVGRQGTLSDNREQLTLLHFVARERAHELPDDAAVAVPVEEIRYPHIVYEADRQTLLVRVMADGPASVALTVAEGLDHWDAVALVRELDRFIRDATIELAELGPYGSLRVARVPYEPIIMPQAPTQDADSEVAANA